MYGSPMLDQVQAVFVSRMLQDPMQKSMLAKGMANVGRDALIENEAAKEAATASYERDLAKLESRGVKPGDELWLARKARYDKFVAQLDRLGDIIAQ